MIKVGSDFSGVGAFNQALLSLNIEYKEVYACDMDKYARQTYIHNYGEPEYYPENVYNRAIPQEPLDIYMTSPPCQSFSLAGKRKGEDDKRGVLFYNSHEFIMKNQPRYFIFENVKGLLSDDKGNTFNKWVQYLGGKSVNGLPTLFPHPESVHYHLYWKVLNAKNYDIPQNRERVFLIGIRDDSDNNFSFPKEVFLSKRLRDVLEQNVGEKYYLSDLMTKGLMSNGNNTFINQNTQASQVFSDNSIFQTLCSGTHGYANGYVNIKSATKIGFETAEIGEDSINISDLWSETVRGKVGKKCAQTIKTHPSQGIAIGAIRGRNPDNPKSRITGAETVQMLEVNNNGTSHTLTTVQKDNVVIEQISSTNKKGYMHQIGSLYQNNSDAGRIYSDNGISCTIKSEGGGLGAKTGLYKIGFRIRRLTPRECFRLMDFPDSFTWTVSDSQAYKQAGNTICKGVLAAIISKFNLKQIKNIRHAINIFEKR